jgi:hypothetical protein
MLGKSQNLRLSNFHYGTPKKIENKNVIFKLTSVIGLITCRFYSEFLYYVLIVIIHIMKYWLFNVVAVSKQSRNRQILLGGR